MSSPVKTADTILGYTLTHRLGSGGYGEVWAAEAPGGLEKAVKLVYGYHDESRAQRELKALNHIKQLRHPFLLSLERIEVADSQLVIVMELAEKCLKTRFEECTAEGLKGIPREELLKYLRDAAEALDFLGAEHGLQHLDIKPENLLILSGHAKVADFGLVKNLNECTQSLMGGLTPTFSAPELFEGKPTRTSDQYSLAIVYQEMLTGRRPFPGTTAADLAAQHMHGRADVSLVPRGDQSVVLRALSKKSKHRYPSCTEFIEELLVRKGQLRPRRDARAGRSSVQRRSSPDVTQIISNSKLPIVASSLEPHSMPRFNLDEKEARVHPTLFIGLGRTGSRVVHELRRKLFQRLGDHDDIPSMRVLCVDTDQDDLTSLSVGNQDQCLTLDETLEIPLRSPDAYRRDTGLRLPWLSRRWLFNIPRSLKTEGVRALGRLAFADHSSTIHERLHKTLREITDPDNLVKTAETVGLEAAAQPRVFIVASTGGGVGSGTVIDCAYAVRAALLQNGLPDDQVVGLLACLGGRSSVERKLSTANTYALLRELSHFSKLGTFPGDESCELPEFQDGRPTFSHTYYVDLGCDLTEMQWAAELESLSEYLYLDAATKANAFFKRARAEDEDDERRALNLRSLSLQRLDVEFQPTQQRIVYDVLKQLVLRWSGREGAPSEFNAGKFTKRVSEDSQLGAADCVHHVERMTSATVGADLAGLLLDSVVEGLQEVNGDPAERARRIASSVSESLQSPKARQGISAGTGFQVAMNTQIHRWVTDTLHQLKARLWELVDVPGHRVAAANVALHAFVSQMKGVKREIEESLTRYVKASELTLGQLSMPETWTSASQPPQVTKYVTLRHRQFFLQWTHRLVDELIRRVGDLSDEVEGLSADMLSVIRTERPVQDLTYAPTPKGQFEQSIARYLQGHIATLTQEVEQILEKNQFDGNGSLSQLIGTHGLSKQEFNRILTNAAQKAVLRAFAGLEIDQIIHESGTSEEALTQWVYQCLSIAKNGLIQCGGQSRLLMAVPASSTTELLSILVEKGFGESPTMVSATPGDVVFCLEAHDVQTLNLAVRLVDQCPESHELIPRVTSRNDIEWHSLTGLT